MTDDTSAPLPLSDAAAYLAATIPLQMACVRSMFHLGGMLAKDHSLLGWSEERLAALDRLSTEVTRVAERWDRVEVPEPLAAAHSAFARACMSYRTVFDLLHRAIDLRDPQLLTEARARLNSDLLHEFSTAQEEQSYALGLIDEEAD